MSVEHPSESYVPSQETKQEAKAVPVIFESLSLLENMSAKELSIQKQQIEAKIQKLQKLDGQQVIAKSGNIYTQSSESDVVLRTQSELDLINKAIENKAKTIQDVFHDDTISYTPDDVLELYNLIDPSTKTNDPRAARDSLKSRVDFTKGELKDWWSLNEILEKLKVPKDNQKYWKIIAEAFIGEQLDTKESSAAVANTTFDTFKRGIEDLSANEQTTLRNITARLTWSAEFLFDEKNIIQSIGSWENYQQTRKDVLKELWVDISEEEYNILAGSARKINTDANIATTRAKENQDIQVAALKKWNLVKALQQETQYQKETSQIAYYRDLRSSLAKNEPNSLNQIRSQSNESINVGSADFSKNLMEFMNDPTLNSIYPKLSDGTALPIIKSWPDSCVVQGCEVRTESVESLIDINQTLANEWLRFFSTKTPLTKILANMEQALRAKGVQNVPNFGDPQTLANYGDNIVDILYQVIDPNPKEQIANVSERINTAHKRFAGSIPLIAYGRQSWVVREDSGIDLNAFTDKLNTMVQSRYPFRFWGEK